MTAPSIPSVGHSRHAQEASKAELKAHCSLSLYRSLLEDSTSIAPRERMPIPHKSQRHRHND